MLLNTIFIVFLPLKCYLKLLRMDVCSVLELILRMGGMCLTVALSLSVFLMSLSSLLLAEVRFFEQNNFIERTPIVNFRFTENLWRNSSASAAASIKATASD